MSTSNIQEFSSAQALIAHYRAIDALPWHPRSKSKAAPVVIRAPLALATPLGFVSIHGPSQSTDITADQIKEAWQALSAPAAPAAPAVIFKAVDIRRAVCTVCGVSEVDFLSSRRPRHIARCRQIFYWICRRYTSFSLVQIGRFSGNKDHSTVLHGIWAVDSKIEYMRPYIDRALVLLEARA